MKKFYCIAHENNYGSEKSPTLLEQSSNDRGIKFVPIYPEEFDHTNIPVLEKGDILYRVSTTKESRIIERLLVNDGVSTFYKNVGQSLRPLANPTVPLALEKFGVSVVPTIYSLPSNREELKKYVEHLGGFPIVIKDMGGSHGVGVMRIDSLESMYSVVDVLLAKGGSYILRKYIDYEAHYRLIVLGDKVVGTVEYPRVEKDFRSNVGNDLHVIETKCSKEVEDVAISAVKAKDFEFGGVDVLVDGNGNPYVAEANFPCFFPRVQTATGIDVSGMMVEHLVKKAQYIVESK